MNRVNPRPTFSENICSVSQSQPPRLEFGKLENSQYESNRKLVEGLNCKATEWQPPTRQCWRLPNKNLKLCLSWKSRLFEESEIESQWQGFEEIQPTKYEILNCDCPLFRSRTFDSSVKFYFISFRDLSSMSTRVRASVANLKFCKFKLFSDQQRHSVSTDDQFESRSWTRKSSTIVSHLNFDSTMNACNVSIRRWISVLSLVKIDQSLKTRMKVVRWSTWATMRYENGRKFDEPPKFSVYKKKSSFVLVFVWFCFDDVLVMDVNSHH